MRFESLIDDLSSVDSKGLNYQDCEVLFQERILIAQDCISGCHLDTGTPLHDVRVITAREYRTCIHSTSLMSLTVRGYPDNFLMC